MSWDIYLVQQSQTDHPRSEQESPAYKLVTVQPWGVENVAGWSHDHAEINVTWNYSDYFIMALGTDLREALHGKSAAAVLSILSTGVERLGGTATQIHMSRQSPERAGAVLALLLSWAEQHPHATFYVE